MSGTIPQPTSLLITQTRAGQAASASLSAREVSAASPLAHAAEGAGAELRYPAGVARVTGDRVEMVNGTTIRATVSALGDERRDELTKLVKKTAETARIQLRSRRDDTMKRVKEGEATKMLTKDDVFKGKEKIQKVIDAANGAIEKMVDEKLAELGE